MPSMIDTLTSLVTPQLVGSLAGRLGESEGAVQKGLTGGAATALTALAGKATDTGFLLPDPQDDDASARRKKRRRA